MGVPQSAPLPGTLPALVMVEVPWQAYVWSPSAEPFWRVTCLAPSHSLENSSMRCLFVVCSATCRGAQEQWRVGVCSCPGARAHQPQEGVGDAAMHGQLPGSRGQSTVTRQQLQKGGKAARLLRRLRRGVERPMAPTSVDEGRGAYLVHHRSEV